MLFFVEILSSGVDLNKADQLKTFGMVYNMNLESIWKLVYGYGGLVIIMTSLSLGNRVLFYFGHCSYIFHQSTG